MNAVANKPSKQNDKETSRYFIQSPASDAVMKQ